MDALFAQQKETIRELVKEVKEKDREIKELKVENSSYDKGTSGFFMWLGAKMRENQLIDPGTARDELRERLNQSKETKRQVGDKR
jgi:hypothetical protein